MKKIIFFVQIVLITFIFSPIQLKAVEKSDVISGTMIPAEKNNNMLKRLNEINEMDKTSLNFSEKKELRNEVQNLKSEMRSSGGGMYISLGAAIIIILLLIILL
jgi:hypothetical protein